MSRDSSVSKVNGPTLDDRDSIPGRVRNFSIRTTCKPAQAFPPPNVLLRWYWVTKRI